VLARASRIGPQGLCLLQAVAIVPSAAGLPLLQALAGSDLDQLD